MKQFRLLQGAFKSAEARGDAAKAVDYSTELERGMIGIYNIQSIRKKKKALSLRQEIRDR